MDATTGIDPRAVVDPGARLGERVSVGPFAVIGAGVVLGDGCRVGAHAVLEGPTEIGPDNAIHPLAAIGGPPQDLKYSGAPTRLTIGSGNTIREFVTIHRGTEGGGGLTALGCDGLYMAYTHIAHDCRIGDRVIFGNAATLAGHVDVGDDAQVGAFSGVHQFCRVARQAFIGGYSVVTRDALPWVMTVGNRATAHGLNLVGLERKGYPRETIDALTRCYKLLFRSKLLLQEAMDRVEQELGQVPEVRYFLEFLRSSERGVCR